MLTLIIAAHKSQTLKMRFDADYSPAPVHARAKEIGYETKLDTPK